MKRLLLALVTIGLVASIDAQPSGYRDPCCPPRSSWLSCCGSFEGGVEILFLRPCLCDLDYAISDSREIGELDVNSLPIGDQLAIRPDYRFGFRVFVGYISECSCYDLRLQYTFHHPTRHVSFIPEGDHVIWPTFGHPLNLNVALFNGNDILPTNVEAEARARVRFAYDAIDVQVGSRRCKCAMWSRVFAGIHYFNLDHRFDTYYQGSFLFFDGEPSTGNLESSVETSRNIWAVGPQIGVEGVYQVACGFGIGGRVWGGVLAGRSRGDYLEHDLVNRTVVEPVISTDVLLDVDYRSRCIVIPVIDARLGVNYTWCCNCCFSLVVEFGYEFLSYINAVNRTIFNDVGATSSTNCQSYDLDGFYLSFRLTL